MIPHARALLRLAATALLATALAGCVTLLPKSKPAQLYRFGFQPTAAATPAPKTVAVLHAGGVFQREAAGDRILTVTESRAAYIADARWVAPAEVLFDEALSRAFDAATGPGRLVARGEPGRADYALRLDVRNFETDYDVRRGGPEVVIQVRAVLTRDPAHPGAAEKIFEARAPAQRNRVTAIVAAYDKALGQVLSDLAAWVNGQLTTVPSPPA